MTFDQLGIRAPLVHRLRQMGYRTPWPIQQEAIPPILAGHDLIGLAQTGKGKTMAFVVPLAEGLLADREAAADATARCLILCPTRELAQQVAGNCAKLVSGTALRSGCVYGKVGLRAHVELVHRGLDILVGTPGRVRELVDGDHLALGRTTRIVLDEADRMLDLGFRPQVEAILSGTPSARQTLFFTATLPPAVEALVDRFQRDPVRVEVGRHTTTVDHVRQSVMPIDDRNKVPLLLHVLAGDVEPGVLVFCRTRRRVGWVGKALERQGIRVGVIHGDRSQAQRRRALDGFEARELDVIVATDVAARGLHVPVVRTVVNYDIPLSAEDYVHRIGRAGHGGSAGASLSLVSPQEQLAWGEITRRLDIDPAGGLPDDFTPPHRPSPTVVRQVERDPMLLRAKDDRESRKRGVRRGRGRGRAASRPIGKNQRPGGGVRKKPPS